MGNPLNESLLDKFKKALRTGSTNKQKGSSRLVQVKDTTRTPSLCQLFLIGRQEEVISGMSGMTPKDLLSQYPKFKSA